MSAYNYTLVCVYGNDIYNRVENTTKQETEKINTQILLNNLKINNTNIIIIYATIKDIFNNNLIGINIFVVKVNGKTLKDNKTGKTIYYTSKRGILNINIKHNYKNIKTITRVTGERFGYQATTTTITLTDTKKQWTSNIQIQRNHNKR